MFSSQASQHILSSYKIVELKEYRIECSCGWSWSIPYENDLASEINIILKAGQHRRDVIPLTKNY